MYLNLMFLGDVFKKKKSTAALSDSKCFIVFIVLKLFPSDHCKSAENTFHTTHIDRAAVLTADAHPLKLKLLCNYFCFLISLNCKKKPV